MNQILIENIANNQHHISNRSFMKQLKEICLSHEKWVGMITDNWQVLRNLEIVQRNANRCNFGHWYDSIKTNDANLKQKWEYLGEVHRKSHVEFYILFYDYNNLSDEERKEKTSR